MKLLLGYLLLSFVVGILLRKQRLPVVAAALFMVCIGVAIGYFFFDQI